MHACRQTDSQTDGGTERLRDSQTERLRQRDTETARQRDRETERQGTGGQRDRETDRQRDRKTESAPEQSKAKRQRDRETGSQPDRQADRQAGRPDAPRQRAVQSKSSCSLKAACRDLGPCCLQTLVQERSHFPHLPEQQRLRDHLHHSKLCGISLLVTQVSSNAPLQRFPIPYRLCITNASRNLKALVPACIPIKAIMPDIRATFTTTNRQRIARQRKA